MCCYGSQRLAIVFYFLGEIPPAPSGPMVVDSEDIEDPEHTFLVRKCGLYSIIQSPPVLLTT